MAPQRPDVCYIQGYLSKKTRDGRWQKRWFETTGCFLTYYKSKKMTKLLAALNLPQVGDIQIVKDPAPDDVNDAGCLFSIHLNDRDYLLKAADPASANRWVDVLNQLKDKGSDPKKADVAVSVAEDAWQKASPRCLALCCCVKKSAGTK